MPLGCFSRGGAETPTFSALLGFRALALHTARESLLPLPGDCILDGYAALLRLSVTAPATLSEKESALLPIARALERVMGSSALPSAPDGTRGTEDFLASEEATDRLLSLLPEKGRTPALRASLTALLTLAPDSPEEANRYAAKFLARPEGERLDAALRQKLEECESEFPHRSFAGSQFSQIEKSARTVAETVLAGEGFSGRFPNFWREDGEARRYLALDLTLGPGPEEDESTGAYLLTLILRGGRLSGTAADALQKTGVAPDLAACFRKGKGRRKFHFRMVSLSILPEGEDGLPAREKETLRRIFAGAASRVLEKPLLKEEKKALGGFSAGGNLLLTGAVLLIFCEFCAVFLGSVFALVAGFAALLIALVTGMPLHEMFRDFPFGKLFGIPFVLLLIVLVCFAVWNSFSLRMKQIRFAWRMKKETRDKR